MAFITLEQATPAGGSNQDDREVTLNTEHITSIEAADPSNEFGAKSLVFTTAVGSGSFFYLVNTREEVVQALDIMEGGAFDDEDDEDGA
jgi:hypothetical protein